MCAPVYDAAFHNDRGPVMSEKAMEGLDRRDFMMASIATVGASAVLASNTGPAKAQDMAASSGDAASGAPRGTLYTGDVVERASAVMQCPSPAILWYSYFSTRRRKKTLKPIRSRSSARATFWKECV